MTEVEYCLRKRYTKRNKFLAVMNEIIPWAEWVAFIELCYLDGKRNRKPLGIERMLMIYLLQCWFNMYDDVVEDEIYDSYAFRGFMVIDFYNEQTHDAQLC